MVSRQIYPVVCCFASSFAGTEDVAALLRQLKFGGGPAAELQQYTQDPATAVEIEIDRAFAKVRSACFHFGDFGAHPPALLTLQPLGGKP